ncbi:MAG: ATP synthase F1 subunit gamma [Planctomycetes bacterium]|nr:ATP synthase F1 subunit gamma [Planctomycetota bacterium]
MAKPRALVKRRKAIRNIRKITRTMELIATARFKRAMDRSMQAEAYTRKITELVRDLSGKAEGLSHPLLEVREPVSRALLLVLCSNRGLCGGYNANVLRAAIEHHEKLELVTLEARSKLGLDVAESLRLEVSGKRGINYFRHRRIRPAETFTHFDDRPRFEEVDALAHRYIEEYTAGRLDRLDVAYTKFLSAARQKAVVETLLPVQRASGDAGSATGSAAVSPGGAGAGPGGPGGHAGAHASAAATGSPLRLYYYEFLPSAGEILQEVLPMAFKVRLFKCFLDAAVGEQIARMVAMKGATENADEMIRRITRLYNRARQAQITKEISEIIGGAEALK